MRSLKQAALFAFVLLGASPQGHAALVQVASRAALGANVTVPWNAFGPIGSTLSVFQQRTVGGEQVSINSSSGLLYVSQQGNGFNGDFAAGAVLLLQSNPDDGETIAFNTPILGFGTDIDPIGFAGSFTAFMAAYDSSNALLGIVSVAGTATGSGAGTAPFIGATSFSDPISYVTFGLVEPGNPAASQFTFQNGVPVLGNVAMDQASLLVRTPEPATWMLLAGCGLALGYGRFAPALTLAQGNFLGWSVFNRERSAGAKHCPGAACRRAGFCGPARHSTPMLGHSTSARAATRCAAVS